MSEKPSMFQSIGLGLLEVVFLHFYNFFWYLWINNQARLKLKAQTNAAIFFL